MSTMEVAHTSENSPKQGPVYLAAQGNSSADPAFIERKIQYMSPGPVSEVVYFATSRGTPGFKTVLEHLHIYGQAQLNNQLTMFTSYRAVFTQMTVPTLFEVPVASFTFDNLSEQSKADIRAMGLTEEIAKPGTFLGTPSAENLKNLFRMGPVPGRFNPGTITHEGYFGYITLIRGYNLFSEIMRTTVRGANVNTVHTKTSVIVDNSDGGPKYLTRLIPGAEPFTKWAEKIPDGSIVTYQPGSVIGAPINASQRFQGVYSGTDGEGLASKSLPGIYFPYFFNLNLPDKELPVHVFRQLFIRCLGNDPDSSAKVWNLVRHGIRAVANSRAGRSLSHIYLGMQIAIETEAAMTIILDGSVYQGFALQANDLNIRMYGRHHIGSTYEQLKKDIYASNSRKVHLQNLCNMINQAVNTDGMSMYTYQIADINSSRKLEKVLHTVDFTHYQMAVDVKNEISKFIKDIAFGDHFDVPSVKSIEDFLTFVETGDESILDKYPAYIADGYWTHNGRVARGLGIFGNKAPSCNFGKNKDMKFTLPASLDAEDPNLKERENGKKVLPYLPFNFIDINTALVQWNSLFADGVMHIPGPRRNKDEFCNSHFVALRVTGDPSFINMYRKIKAISITTKANVGAGKRKRDGEEGPENARKKARANAIDIADLM